MCQCIEDKKTSHNRFGEKKYRLADYFDKWWDIYKMNPKEFIHQRQYKAADAIRVCRTAALGVDIFACPDCGDTTEVYHSCKNRFCPTCSWNDTVRWAEKVKRNMLNIPHRHVVFTIPHQLIPLIKKNEYALLNMQMRVSADTLKSWADNKYGLRLGIISVLHTAGEVKNFHPHLHMIVSWGGVNTEGSIQQIKGEYINYEFLREKFRYRYENMLVDMFDNDKLVHNFKNRIDFLRFLKSINKKNWVVHFEPPMETPEQVIRYIGRYSKRACLSEHKISQMEGETIGFLYKDYKYRDSDGKALTREAVLNYRDFFPRLLQHVPLPYFRLVRYYGIYSNKGHLPREYFYQPEDELPIDWASIRKAMNGQDPMFCQHCNKTKVYVHTIAKKKDSDQIHTYYVLPRSSKVLKRTAA